MPSPSSPLFCSWAPYCLVDQCLGGWLLVCRNFTLNPVIVQHSGELKASGVHPPLSVRWEEINQSTPRQKTPGNPPRAPRAQPSVGLMSDFGPRIRRKSVLLFLWCGDYTACYRHSQRAEMAHFPTKWHVWIMHSLVSPKVAWKNW